MRDAGNEVQDDGSKGFSRSRLSTVNCNLNSLIANETHSPEESCACKQSTYEILIANELRLSRDAFSLLPCLPASVIPALNPRSLLANRQAKLDFSLNTANSTTSQFLFDNFGSGFYPASGFEPPASSSNRPSPRLEILVSDRKQRVGAISNRPYFALFDLDCSLQHTRNSSNINVEEIA